MGYQLHHKFVSAYIAMKGKTRLLSKPLGSPVESNYKWMTIRQNESFRIYGNSGT